jgi:hypothetical protein
MAANDSRARPARGGEGGRHWLGFMLLAACSLAFSGPMPAHARSSTSGDQQEDRHLYEWEEHMLTNPKAPCPSGIPQVVDLKKWYKGSENQVGSEE